MKACLDTMETNIINKVIHVYIHHSNNMMMGVCIVLGISSSLSEDEGGNSS